MRINKNLLSNLWSYLAFPMLFMLLNAKQAQAQTYCAAANTDANGAGSYIANVSFGTILNNTGSTYPTSGYSYFPGQTTTLILGSTEPLTVTIDNGSSYPGAIVSVWFDWNQDGIFSASEWTQVSTNIPSGTSATVNITVPTTALPGTTRMRLRSRGTNNQNGANDACLSMGSGDTEDYDVIVSAGSPCSGTPTAGSVSPLVPDSICPNIPFNLLATGFTLGTGMTYQWQSATAAAGPWNDITGATAPSYAISAGISTATYYRLKVQCNNGTPQYSPAKFVQIKNWISCYCTPTYTYGCSNGATINSVSTTGGVANISNLNSGCTGNGYQDYTSMTVSGMPATSFDITTAVTQYGGVVKIWVDWNHDGNFDPVTELVANSTTSVSSGSNYTATILIPGSALTGNTRMRVRIVEGSNNSFSPCDNQNYGETEDYTLHVITPTPCVNPPTPGSITGVDSICPNTAFVLNSTGFSTGTGLVYQWQSSSSATGTFTDIAGATATMLNVSTGIAANTYYRMKLVCSNGTPVYTPVKAVTVQNFLDCHCTPTYSWGCSFGATLNSFSTTNAATNITNNNTGCTGPYTNYTSLSASAMAGTSFDVSIGVTSYDAYAKVWIDFNQDGVFSATELAYNGTSIIYAGSSATATIQVPATALPGTTKMRVRVVESYSIFDACDLQGYGETEDYRFVVIPATPCTNPPTAGTIVAPDSICPTIDFTITASGFTMGSGMTYQWQSAPSATGTFTDIAGATTTNLNVVGGISTATSYRLKVVCSNGTPQYSNVETITITSPNNCYCAPTYTWDCMYDDDIDDFTLVGATVTLSNLNTPCPTGGYADYTTSTTLGVPDMLPGATYSGTVTTNYTGAYEYYTIWIDYNANGVFETSEQVATGGPISDITPGTYTISVPATASAGLRRLRVVLAYNVTPTDPCGNYSYGEAHDYMVQIGPGCAIPAVNLGVDTSICDGTALTLTAPTGTGLTYAWNTGATTPTIDATATGTYYVTVDDGSCTKSDTIVVSIIPNPVVNLGNDTTDCVNGGPITLTAGSATSNVYAWSTGASTPSISATTSGTYSVTVTNAAGCSASDTVVLVMGQLPSVGGITVTGTSPNFNFSANNPSNATNYSWNFGDGATSNSENAQHSYTPGTQDEAYTVTLIVSNECGADTVTTTVTIRANGINDLKLSNDALKLYPNPTTNTVTIENTTNFKMKQIVISNVLGQEVLNTKVSGNTAQILNVSHLNAGLYHVSIEFEEGIVTRKLEILK
jgi:hypothetical protein